MTFSLFTARAASSELPVAVERPPSHVADARDIKKSAPMDWPAVLSVKSAIDASALLVFPPATTAAWKTSAVSAPFVGSGGPFADFLQIGGVPLIHPGDDARFMLIGAKELGGTTLLRFYVLHCVGIPLGAAILMAVHFWRIRKDGGISGPL